MQKTLLYALNDQKRHLNNVFIVSIYAKKQDKSKQKTIYTQKQTLDVNATKRSASVYSGQKGSIFSFYTFFFRITKLHTSQFLQKEAFFFSHHLHHHTCFIFNLLSPHHMYRARQHFNRSFWHLTDLGDWKGLKV